MVMAAAVDRVTRFLAPWAAPSAGLSAVDIAYAARTDGPLRAVDADYALFWDYYRGHQRDPNAAPLDTFTPRTYAGAHNVAGVAIDALVERLHVEGFTAVGDGISADQIARLSAIVDGWWQANRMDEHQGTIHARALVQGDAYVVLGWDAARDLPTFRVHTAEQVTPVYVDGVMTEAYKLWSQTYLDQSAITQTRWRLTRYRPDTIEKWYQDGLGSSWQRWTGDVDSQGRPDGGVVDWTDARGMPLGIPVIHVRNAPRGDDFGHSDIADLIAAQDSINRRVAALDEASGFQGAAQWWGLDLNAAALQAAGVTTGPGTLLMLQSQSKDKAGSVGSFPPGDVDKLLGAVIGEIKILGSIARVPMHLLYPADGTFPSGEALKTAEAPLVAKATDRQIVFGNAYEDLLVCAVRLHNAFSRQPALPETATWGTRWASPATRSALTDEQELALQADDLSWQERMRRRGYSDAEIEQIKAEKDAETPPALQAVDAELTRIGTQGGDA